MSDTNHFDDNKSQKKREPVFNLPSVIIVLVACLVSVHIIKIWALSSSNYLFLHHSFSFNPKVYTTVLDLTLQYPAQTYQLILIILPRLISHAFLHSDWTHLLLNVGFMVAFGAPVAKRFGNIRFLILFVLSAAGGALFFWLINPQEVVYLIGASGAVSGFMGAASRFAFQPNFDEMGVSRPGLNVSGPALSLLQCAKDRKFLNFFAIWMVMNILFGTVFSTVLGGSGNIAWEAHIGGFLAGIFAFSLLDPRIRYSN